jgi:hypothetical protein
MVLYRLTSVRSLARFLIEQPEIARACEFKSERIPSYRTLCRRFGCLDNWILEWCRVIITALLEARIVKLKTLIIDGTPGQSKCKRPKGEVMTRPSDPEAGFGTTNWGKEWFFGYKAVILATAEPLIIPLSWQVIPANKQEVNYLIPVVSKAAWLIEAGKKYELVADCGFDAQYNYDWCQKLNIRFTCPLNQGNEIKGQRIKRQKFYKSKGGQKLYQRRTDIERLNGQLKELFLIDPFTVKRLKNVITYLNLAMLCYLAAVYYNFTEGRGLREIKSLIA